MQKKNLQRARDELEESRQNLLSYDDKFDRLALKKAKLVLRHQEQLSVLRDANHAVLEAHIRHIEALSDVTALKERNSGIVQRLEEERRKVEELDRQVEQAKSLARNAQNAIKELLTVPDSDGEMDTERRDYLIGLTEGKTVETITEDIETEHAKLDLIHAADPGVLRDFEKRARDIEKLEAENITKRTDLEQLNERIQELREVWEPALDSIIRRINDAFSYNFEQISCAGEVGVHKDEDFDKWAIEIKVKFRYATPSLVAARLERSSSANLAAPLTEKTKPSRSSTNIASPAASVPSRPSSISCPCSRWRRRPSVWSTRSIKVWTRGTSAWCTSVWWRSRAGSTRRSTSSSRPSCSPD